MKYVAISIHGNYLSLSGGSPGTTIEEALANAVGGLVMANGTGIGDPSIFERVELGEGQVSFRMLDGAFLHVVGDRVGRTQDEAAASVFTEVWWPDDRISLRAPSGVFVCAEGGGGNELVVNRPEAGDWEKFFYEQVPAELLPADSTAGTRVEGRVDQSVVDAIRQQADRSDAISEIRRPFP